MFVLPMGLGTPQMRYYKPPKLHKPTSMFVTWSREWPKFWEIDQKISWIFQETRISQVTFDDKMYIIHREEVEKLSCSIFDSYPHVQENHRSLWKL